ncbi:MAG: hypothetical protein WCA11_00325 [Terracidiphilus sp.]
MLKRPQITLREVVILLALAGLPLYLVRAARAQDETTFPINSSHWDKSRKLSDNLPEQPSLPPAFTIPVQPLGYSAPGPFYLGRHNRLVSLDFLDENRLLFTFQVPGLMHRRTMDNAAIDERQIRAVVVSLPQGKVEADALWAVHDRIRYLWMLNDGHFLLRDRDALEQGDATLHLKPFLRFPGRLLWIEMDPEQQFMDADYLMPAATEQKSAQVNIPPVPRSATAPSQKLSDVKPDLKPDLVMRTLRRDSGEMVLESRIGLTVQQPTSSDGYTEVEAAMLSGMLQRAQLPINSVGFLQNARNDTNEWYVSMKSFAGTLKDVATVESKCEPTSDFISEREFLVTACDLWDGWDLIAMASNGRPLWEDKTSSHEIWAQWVHSQDGTRIAREAVLLNHPMTHGLRPLKPENVKGQLVRVLNAADGRVVLETVASPTLDGGGNIAISPSGRRAAVLNDGAIQVFELPPH